MSGTLLLESLDSRQAGLELDGLNTCALVIHLQTTDLVLANGFFFFLSVTSCCFLLTFATAELLLP